MAYGARRGLSAVSCGLVEVTGKVARGAELEVALDTPVLGIVLRRVLHYHPDIVNRKMGDGRVDRKGMGEEWAQKWRIAVACGKWSL
jgi:hypothetical protein